MPAMVDRAGGAPKGSYPTIWFRFAAAPPQGVIAHV